MIRIYDCSNSSERPRHRAISLCPKENDIVRDLKANAYLFGCEFINNYRKADVIFTNDVFPKHLINSNKFKVKRMDGTFWRNDLIKRNERLNNSAEKADYVIFISQYSSNSYYDLYGKGINHSTIILNNVCGIFRRLRSFTSEVPKVFTANASNWEREEKRFKDLMLLAKHIKGRITLIGKCRLPVARNVIKVGYTDDYLKLNSILNSSDAFINLSYRDAAPKVVCQAVACGLPILYADSGGTRELIDYGVSIYEEDILDFRNRTPRLELKSMLQEYNELKERYLELENLARQPRRNYFNTLNRYFNIFKMYREDR